jgi:hypothetical protein
MARTIADIRSITIDDLFEWGYEQAVKQQAKTPHPIEWIEANFVDPITKQLVILMPHQKRILRRALMMDKDGYSKYSLVFWSEPKKSGKTTIAAAVGAYVASCIEAPNEISCVANDKEQAAGRIYRNMVPTLINLGWQVPASERGKQDRPTAFGANGSMIRAITTDYEKEAGANQGISLWSELWAYGTERLSRLWEEMTPPPTRKFSMRWVETYAGFLGESKLLWGYYNKIYKNVEELEIQDRVIKLWNDLPVYELDERMLVYWSHEPRMPWQTKTYYTDQRANMRYSSYIRLHENRWVEAAGDFITHEMWENSERYEKPSKVRATYALDASKNGACTALVGCAKGKDTELMYTTDVHMWESEHGEDINFNDVMETIVKLHKEGRLRPPLWYDPYQCVKLAQDLRLRGVPCKEFGQGNDRIKSDTFLYKLYKEGSIINYLHPGLKSHILNAKEKTYPDQKVRIIKPEDEIDERNEDSSVATQFKQMHIDLAVAQSMAAYKAYTRPGGGWGMGKEGW